MTAPHGSALVTGSSGFIGGHLLRRLALDGVSVTGLDLLAPPPDRPLPEGARHVIADVRDVEAVTRAVAEAQPEVVYHFAAQASVSVSMRDPVLDVATNVLGTIHLARAAAEAGVRRFVFASTGGALFGAPEHVPVTDDTPPAPVSIYGLSKLSAERYLALIGEQHGLSVSVLRPGNVYGPAQDPHGEAGVVAIFAARMLAGEAVTIFGDGGQRRDYVYVDDVVGAAMLAATERAATCLIGSGVETSTLEVFEALARLTGYQRAPEFRPERPGDIARIALDPAQAKRVWGWEPSVDVEQGLDETVEWFRARRG